MFLKLLLTSPLWLLFMRGKSNQQHPKKHKMFNFLFFVVQQGLISALFQLGVGYILVYPKSTFFTNIWYWTKLLGPYQGFCWFGWKIVYWKKVCDIWARCPLLKKSCQGFVVPWTLLSLINNKKSRSRSGFWLNWCKLSIEASILPICPVFVLGASQARVPSSFFTKEPSIEKGHFCKKGNQWSYINLLLLLLLKRRATELLVNSLPFSIQIYHWL